jgi:hypothetical protein
MKTAVRTYTIGTRSFEVRLCALQAYADHKWSVESVIETSRGGRALVISDLNGIMAPTEELAFARACRQIDVFLGSAQ